MADRPPDPEDLDIQRGSIPTYALAAIDTVEYHGAIEPAEASPFRRRIFEATSRTEIIEILNELLEGLDDDKKRRLQNVADDSFFPVDGLLFDLSRSERR